MQHLDDALIAEWVDGAIAERSPQHAAIAAHVDQCEECRLRVDEERALAGHVRQLLGVAAPPERVPPFEEVLHRAGASAGRAAPARAGLPWRRLAWAATVVAAGGVGWYARGLLIASGEPRADVPAALAGREAPSIPEATAVAESDRTPEPARALGGVVARQDTSVAPGAAGQPAPVREEAAVADHVVPAEARVADETRAARRDAVTPPAAPAPAAAEPRALAQVAAPTENEARMEKAALGTWIPTPRQEAERVLAHSLLTIPDLPVIGIDVAVGSSIVRVRQDLGSGAVLELVQSRPVAVHALAPEAAAGAAAAPRERFARSEAATVEAVMDGVHVLLRAPVSADSLRVLLSKVGP